MWELTVRGGIRSKKDTTYTYGESRRHTMNYTYTHTLKPGIHTTLTVMYTFIYR